MADNVPMTLGGKTYLEDELKRLKHVERPIVIKAIEEARALGDLSENAEYAAAREKQSFIEGRILDLGDKIARAEVIDPKAIKSDKVMFGATVLVEDEDGKKSKYQIVGDFEADLARGLLSIQAPLARALVGKKVDEEATVRTPKGEAIYTISKIEYI